MGHKAGANKGNTAVSRSASSDKFAAALPRLVMGDLSPPPQKSKVFRVSFCEVHVAICACVGPSPVGFDPLADLKHIFTQGKRP